MQNAWLISLILISFLSISCMQEEDIQGAFSDSGFINYDDTGPTFTNLSINSPTVVQGGSTYTVSWNWSGNGTVRNLQFQYKTTSTEFYTTPVNITPTATSTDWVVPQVDTAEARIRVFAVSTTGKTYFAETSEFIIDSTPPQGLSLTSLSPYDVSSSTQFIYTSTSLAVGSTTTTDSETIAIYNDNSCSNLIGQGTYSSFNSTGILLTFDLDKVNHLYGIATDRAAKTSSCTDLNRAIAVQSAIIPNEAYSDPDPESVDVDGNWAAFGMISASPNGMAAAGKVEINQWSGGQWNYHSTITAPTPQRYANFGSDVVLQGNILAVGANYQDTDDGTDAGAVFIYLYNGSSWVYSTMLTASDATGDDRFGSSLDMHSNRLIVGAETKDDGGGNDTGGVYIFHYDGTNWTQVLNHTPGDISNGEFFGDDVAIYNNQALVGAYNHNDTGGSQGAVYCYEWNGTSWSQVQKIMAVGKPTNTLFGTAVDLNSSFAVIGAEGSDTYSANQGEIFFYSWTGTNWGFIESTAPTDSDASDFVGNDLKLDGEALMVAGYFAASKKGRIYRYQWTGTTFSYQEYFEEPTFQANNGGSQWGYDVGFSSSHFIAIAPSDEDYIRDGAIQTVSASTATWSLGTATSFVGELGQWNFGASAIAQYGSWLAVSDQNDSEYTGGIRIGAVSLYKFENGAWTFKQKILPHEGNNGIEFGHALDMYQDRLVIGAYRYPNASSRQGRAYLYTLSGDTWSLADTFMTLDGNVAQDQFGYSLYMHEDKLGIGVLVEDTAGLNLGAVYMYTWTGTTYSHTEKVLPPGGTANQSFGSAVSFNDTHMVVGAMNDDTNAANAGRVYFYSWTGTNWNYVSGDSPADAINIGDGVGTYAVMGNNVAVVGAYLFAGSDKGRAYVYQYSGGTWSLIQTLTNTLGENPDDNLGYRLDLQGNDLIVGVKGHRNGTNQRGAVFLYTWTGTNFSHEVTYQRPNPSSLNEHFGSTVRFSKGVSTSTNILVGIEQADDRAYNGGAAVVIPYK